MNKIPTLFERDKEFKVIPRFKEEVVWLFDYENVIATEKIDGTNVRVTIENGLINKLEKRKNPTKEEKAKGIEPSYIDAHRKDPSDKHIFGCIDEYNNNTANITDGIYSCEAYGKKIQGDYLKINKYGLYFFTYNPIVVSFSNINYNFAQIKQVVLNLKSQINPDVLAEGIVFHHKDGRMAKIKRKDF